MVDVPEDLRGVLRHEGLELPEHPFDPQHIDETFTPVLVVHDADEHPEYFLLETDLVVLDLVGLLGVGGFPGEDVEEAAADQVHALGVPVLVQRGVGD